MVAPRRGFLAAAGGLLLSGCGRSSGGGSASKTDRGTQIEGDIEVISGLLEIERQARTFYDSSTSRLFARLAQHEAEHVRRLEQALSDLGAKPSSSSTSLELNGEDEREFASKLENTSIAAYLDAIPKLADPKLRTLAAEIVAVEAEHLAVVTGLSDQAFVAGEREL